MSNYTVGVQIITTLVTSTSVPVSIVPPGFQGRGYNIKVRVTNADSSSGAAALIFPYTATVPGSVPAGAREVVAGENFGDNITSASSGNDNGIGSGWAAVVYISGNSTIDVTYS